MTTNTANFNNFANNITPPQDPGYGDLAYAYDLGTIEGNLTVEESVGGNDQGDLYQITIDQAGEYTFNLDDLTADATLLLYDPNDTDSEGVVEPFELSESSGIQSEEITVDLEDGTYYVGVASADGSLTNYNLDIFDGVADSETIVPAQDPGRDDVADAYDLGTIEENLTVEESVGGNDQGDLYQITIDQAGEYTFSLDDLAANADLYLFDPNDTIDGEITAFEDSELSGTQSEEIAVDLDVGTYYVGVFSNDGSLTDYNLTISDGGIADDYIDPNLNNDPGETLETAENIANLTGETNNYTYITSGSVSDSDPIDFYQFTTETTRELNVFLNGLTADADLRLYDSNNQLLGESDNDNSQTENLSETIDAGIYYVGVFSDDIAETDYSLNIFLSPTSTSYTPVEMDLMTNPMSEDFSLV